MKLIHRIIKLLQNHRFYAHKPTIIQPHKIEPGNRKPNEVFAQTVNPLAPERGRWASYRHFASTPFFAPLRFSPRR